MSGQSAGASLAIPDDPGALTSEWLTMALRVRSSIADAVVIAVTCEPIGVVGWSTRLARLTLTYDRIAALGLANRGGAYRAVQDALAGAPQESPSR